MLGLRVLTNRILGKRKWLESVGEGEDVGVMEELAIPVFRLLWSCIQEVDQG